MTSGHRAVPSISNGLTNGSRRRPATVVAEEFRADVFGSLGAAVLVEPPQGIAIADPPPLDVLVPGDVEEEELEKEEVPPEEQDGADDPVRMYLREIGKVYLLSGADEKRLARQMEEAKHLDALEKHW